MSGETMGFLAAEMKIENEVEAVSLKTLARELAAQARYLSDVLNLTAKLASCHWRCRRTDHDIENVLRRAFNYAFAALRLALFGLYYDAFALLRTLAEVSNLLRLFAADGSRQLEWKRATKDERRRNFLPVKVRLSLEQLGVSPAVDQGAYAALSEIGVPVSPESIYLSHADALPAGGVFSETGLRAILRPLSLMAAACLVDGLKLISNASAQAECDKVLPEALAQFEKW